MYWSFKWRRLYGAINISQTLYQERQAQADLNKTRWLTRKLSPGERTNYFLI